MTISYHAICDIGCVRANNEDMILVDRDFLRDQQAEGIVAVPEGCRFAAIVADGMGGNDGGELASDIAAQEFDTWLSDLPEGLTPTDIGRSANDFAVATHALINARGDALEGFHGMGTTIVGVFHYADRWYWINVGDSRLYVFRDGIQRQISRDHSYRNLYNDPTQPSNLIYNALGGGSQYEVFADCDTLPLFAGDRLLVCSDGLCDMISDADIQQIMECGAEMSLPLSATAAQLVDAAKAAGGLDNISVILLSVSE